MTVPMVPIPTDVGLTAVLDAQTSGLQVTITHIALGDGAWTPDHTATALQSEVQRVPIAAAQAIPPNQLHLSALVDGPGEYWIREVGIIADGVLLAVWSHPETPLAYKSADMQIVFNHDVILNAYPPEAVTVANLTTDLNLTLVNELTELATAIVASQHREVLDLLHRLDLDTRLAALEAATT